MHRLFQAGRGILMGVALAALAGAAPVASAPTRGQAQTAQPRSAQQPATSPVELARVIASYPHDPRAFTQGLFFSDGRLFESTGQHGESALREVELKTGRVLREVKLPRRYFGEGSTAWGKTIISLTWQHGVAFRWDRDTFRELGQFRYTGEGWGLTHDATHLIMSDGSAELRFLDPTTFAERRRLRVTWQGKPVRQLNELEYVRGEVLANIWHSDLIARIDPTSGAIKGFIDLSEVTDSLKLRDSEAVLNGIAYDAKHHKLYITGKDWPKLFEIALPR
jgi:glutamine cyclotransferase